MGTTSSENSTPSFTDNEDPPGIHSLRKIRRDILEGYYVDVFSLLKPEGEEDHGRNRDRSKKGVRREGVKRTFYNWSAGYAEFVGVVRWFTQGVGGT